MSPQAGAMSVSPNQDQSAAWWANAAADVTTRACFFDDDYVFNADGSFSNVLGAQTWLEPWQNGTEGCGVAIAPHNGSNATTYTYNSTANTITLTGVGAYLGIPKAYNGGELSTPANAPASITYSVVTFTTNQLTIEINVGGGWWRFKMEKQVVASPLEGTWKMSPQAGAMSVSPNQDQSAAWWANGLGDVTTRACFFDDDYVFNANGTFSNVLGTQTWLEAWQGSPEGCGTPIAPHNGSNAATYTYNSTANTITVTGVGAYLGIPKAYNGGELTTPANAPASITYSVVSLTSNLLTVEINIGGGWWRFKMQKQGVMPTCTDGIMNGDETGVDCGGSCPNACLAQINLPVTFEGNSVNYAVTDFGGNASSLVVDPTNPSNMVMKSIKTPSAELWAGTTIGTNAGFSSAIPFTSANRKMYVSVWSPDAGIPVRLKVEVSGQPTQSCETQTNTTVAGAWETIEFNFNNEASGTAAFNPAFPFNVASIFFNFGTTGATAGEKTYYFDNVSYGAALANTSFNVANVKMYPNPTSNSFTIDAENNIENVSLFNVLGQKVVSKNYNSNSVIVNISNLQSGIYIVKTTINGVITTSRIMKK